jgi:Domain of unknown function (DUF4864)
MSTEYPPQLPPAVPPPLPQKEEGVGKYVLIAVGGCLVMLMFAGTVGFFFWYIFKATADPLKVVNLQLAALRQDDLEKAYSYCSTGFKQITNYQSFQNFVKGNPLLKNAKEFKSMTRAIEQGTAKLKGSLVSNDGGSTPAEYHLVREGRDWKVQYIDLGAAGAAQPAQLPPTEQRAQPALQPQKTTTPTIQTGDLTIEQMSVQQSLEGDVAVIKISFKVFGFLTDTSVGQPRMHLVQDLKTFGPDGNLLPELSKDEIKDLEEYGTFEYADLWNTLKIPSSYPRGSYRCELTVHDKVGGRDTTFTAEFQLQ